MHCFFLKIFDGLITEINAGGTLVNKATKKRWKKMKSQDLSQIDWYKYNTILVVRLNYIYRNGYIEKKFRKRKDGGINGSYSH